MCAYFIAACQRISVSTEEVGERKKSAEEVRGGRERKGRVEERTIIERCSPTSRENQTSFLYSFTIFLLFPDEFELSAISADCCIDTLLGITSRKDYKTDHIHLAAVQSTYKGEL